MDGNAQINQLLAPLEVGHEVDISAKYRVLHLPVCKCVSVANSWQTFRPGWKVPNFLEGCFPPLILCHSSSYQRNIILLPRTEIQKCFFLMPNAFKKLKLMRVRIFFLAAEFFCQTGQNLGSKSWQQCEGGQINTGKFSFRPVLKRSRQMIWYLYVN